jgi:hypothetical protein
MKKLVFAAALFLGCAGTTYAADYPVPMKAAVPAKAPAEPLSPAPCYSLQDFIFTGCQLTWNGVRFYGTIDMGYGYQTHGAPLGPFFTPGAS